MVGEPPTLPELTRRMVEFGLPVAADSNLDPSRLAKWQPVRGWQSDRLHNRAGFFIGGKLKFVAGLVSELARLREKATDEQIQRSSLQLLFGKQGTETPKLRVSESALVEVVRLNDEQRRAVHAGLEQPLTVVTGPPGTGKSQVVIALLANAYLRGDRVLFASRNQKAVEVVETRLNALAAYPLAIRAESVPGIEICVRRCFNYLVVY